MMGLSKSKSGQVSDEQFFLTEGCQTVRFLLVKGLQKMIGILQIVAWYCPVLSERRVITTSLNTLICIRLSTSELKQLIWNKCCYVLILEFVD